MRVLALTRSGVGGGVDSTEEIYFEGGMDAKEKMGPATTDARINKKRRAFDLEIIGGRLSRVGGKINR